VITCYSNYCLLLQRTAHGLDDSGDNRYSRKKHGTGSGEGTYTVCGVCYVILTHVVSPGMTSYPSPVSPDEITKVTFYLDKDDTPYRTSIPKRLVLLSYMFSKVSFYTMNKQS